MITDFGRNSFVTWTAEDLRKEREAEKEIQMREKAKANISKSLIGKFGPNSRAWKGECAGYVAKHSWIIKHYGKAQVCSVNSNHKAKRYEWHNLSGEYKRTIGDWTQLCPSCHRIFHKGNYCKRGHKFTKENTYIRKEGWRVCKTCQKERNRKWKAAV